MAMDTVVCGTFVRSCHPCRSRVCGSVARVGIITILMNNTQVLEPPRASLDGKCLLPCARATIFILLISIRDDFENRDKMLLVLLVRVEPRQRVQQTGSFDDGADPAGVRIMMITKPKSYRPRSPLSRCVLLRRRSITDLTPRRGCLCVVELSVISQLPT